MLKEFAPLKPGSRRLRLCLEAVDLARLDHRQADVVEAVEQAVLAVRIDVEGDLAAVGAADLLLLQVDGQRRIGAALGVVEQLLQDRKSTRLNSSHVEISYAVF